jgi:hypothetical protein
MKEDASSSLPRNTLKLNVKPSSQLYVHVGLD